MSISDNGLVSAAVRLVTERLPPGWGVQRVEDSAKTTPRLRFVSKDGRFGELVVAPLRRPDPRSVRLLPPGRTVLVAAAYLSRGVREVLTGLGVSYVDQTGNVRLVLDEPGLFVLTAGADANPWPEERQLTLRGVKAGRVVRALIQSLGPLGIRQLAGAAGTDPGYVSRLLAMLDREALIERSSRGQIEDVDWRKLLQRWAEEAPLQSRSTASTWLVPRGLSALLDGLREATFPYLLTGSSAAARLAPVAPARLASIYVRDLELARELLELRSTKAGANVILLLPEDDALFDAGEVADGLRYAPLPVVVADLLSGPGRSPAEAEAVMDWMARHVDVWRG